MRAALALIPLLAMAPPAHGEPRLAEARDAPAGWRGLRDRDTGVLTAMWGQRVVVPGASADATIAERAARRFLETHLAQLAPGVRSTDFVLVTNQLDPDGKRTVAFAQRWHGLEVVGGQLSMVIMRDAIFVALSQAQAHVAASLEIRGAELRRPTASFARATATIGAATISPAERVVMLVDGRYEIADRAVASDGRERWDVAVALDGTPLLVARQARDATATLALDVPAQRPTSTRISVPASELAITVDGAPVTTSLTGTFDFAGAGSVITSVAGPRVNVVSQAGAPASATLPASDGATTTWSAATDELLDAQLAAFAHVSIGKARARIVIPRIAAWIDASLRVSVNEPGGGCNASSASDGLHFFASTAACENTARIADVVYHELGHAVHAAAVIAGAGSTGNLSLGEGLADFFAINITDEPTVGRGFAYDDTPVREIDPVGDERVAPEDLVAEPHISGLVIAGALWDLREMLIAAHGRADGIARTETIYAGLLGRAPNIAGTYAAALVADDDDGDLGNGTPNQCELDRAFARHGLAPASVTTTTVSPPVVQGTTISVPVRIPPSSCTEPGVVTMQVEMLREGAAPTLVELTRDATGNLWGGTIPAPADSEVRYRVITTLEDGQIITLPNNRADRYYTLSTRATEVIWCESFATDPMWPQVQMGSPAPWQVGMPEGLAGDPAAAFSGANVLGIDVLDDGRYAAIGETTITTPPIDVAGYDHVHLQYRRWLTVEDGLYDQASVEVNGQPIWVNAASEAGILDHLDHEWRLIDERLATSDTGPTLTVAWKLASDDSRQLGGWTLDDVCILGEPTGRPPTPEEDAGCCATSRAPRTSSLLGLGVLALVLRRRRR